MAASAPLPRRQAPNKPAGMRDFSETSLLPRCPAQARFWLEWGFQISASDALSVRGTGDCVLESLPGFARIPCRADSLRTYETRFYWRLRSSSQSQRVEEMVEANISLGNRPFRCVPPVRFLSQPERRNGKKPDACFGSDPDVDRLVMVLPQMGYDPAIFETAGSTRSEDFAARCNGSALALDWRFEQC